MTGTVEPSSWKATDYLDEPDCAGHTGLTAVDTMGCCAEDRPTWRALHPRTAGYAQQ